jgi:hypothetical protein
MAANTAGTGAASALCWLKRQSSAHGLAASWSMITAGYDGDRLRCSGIVRRSRGRHDHHVVALRQGGHAHSPWQAWLATAKLREQQHADQQRADLLKARDMVM